MILTLYNNSNFIFRILEIQFPNIIYDISVLCGKRLHDRTI